MPADPSHRNLAAVSWTSFLTDWSSQMVLHLVPLYLAGPLGLRMSLIGLIEGVAEGTASLLKLVSGWTSDRLRSRKWLAVGGYGLSALSKPLFLLAGTGVTVAAVRWLDRIGKGIRVAPRDALLADSIGRERRGFAFGFHRAADTVGAMLGLGIAMLVVWWFQGAANGLSTSTFRAVIAASIVPAVLAVVVLAVRARDVPRSGSVAPEVGAGATVRPKASGLRALGRPFAIYLAISAVFDLGNSADAFLVLRASESGLSVLGILAMLMGMNLVFAWTSYKAGAWSDRVGRRRVLALGWSMYALVYLALAMARSQAQVWTLVTIYGVYHGLTQGTARAMVADLVPPDRRGTAFGVWSAVMGLLDIPASILAGILWQGFGAWNGWGPGAPFLFGGAMAAVAAVALAAWRPRGAFGRL